jgi:hypothetical protein
MPSLRDYAHAAAASGVYLLMPVLLFGTLAGLELAQTRTAASAALAVLGGLVGMAGGIVVPSSRRRQRDNRLFLDHLEPDERARWEHIIVLRARSVRGAVVGLPMLGLLGVLVFGLTRWPWVPPSLGAGIAVGVTSALALGTLAWSLQWLVVAWSAYFGRTNRP